MRRSLKHVIFIFCLFLSVQILNAQPLPPGGGHGQTGDQVPGGGAPVGSGVLTLLVLGGAYAGKKFFGNSEE